MEVATSESMVQEVAIPWWVVLLQGICALIIGFLLLTETGATLLTFVILLGIYWFVLGIFDLVRMFSDPAGWGWKLLSGIIGILAGLVLIRHPLWSAAIGSSILVWVVGGLGLVMGVVSIIRAIAGGGWGMAIAGALSILLGLLLLFNTATTVVVMIYTAGVLLVVGGIAGIVGAIMLRVRMGSGAKRMAPTG
ncbi:MAG TPA: DUF308 domain-containing protein [Candidatus Dormibacteraeota bacterium]|nr:DUF308 domain-containing protein [Candidatus Dormibacteraeota bacterium]